MAGTSEQTAAGRQSFGWDVLDRALGGGLKPGTLTVVAGATGVGKTQLGLKWAGRGREQEGARGVFLDLTSRGDSQNHEEYADRLHGWMLESRGEIPLEADRLWEESGRGDLFRPFHGIGRCATRPDLEPEAWHSWQVDRARLLREGAAFAYGHLARGVRRLVFDGFEPTERASDSMQFQYFEYLYEKVIRQEHDWAAREVLREGYRKHEASVLSHAYDVNRVGCLVLATSPQVMLDDLLREPIGKGDLLATANTVILMGRVPAAGGYGRALCVVKHRGSACDDRLIPFRITNRGLEAD